MVQIIGREDVRHLTAQGAALIDVLPHKEYERIHLPGAVNLPLTDLYPFSAALGDKGSASLFIATTSNET